MDVIEWDYSPLIERVRQLSNDPSELETHLSSLHWKYNMFQYHRDESLRLVDAACPTHYNLPPDGLLRLHAEAHLIAAAQVTHSMADVMAHVVHYSLRLVLTDGELENLSFNSVIKHLSDPTYMTVKTRIESCRSTPQFRQIEGFVNVTKHRSLVQNKVRTTKNQNHALSIEIHFDKFSQKNKQFPATTSQDFLEVMHKVIGDVVDVGRALENVIRIGVK